MSIHNNFHCFDCSSNKNNKEIVPLIDAVINQLKDMEIDTDMADLHLRETKNGQKADLNFSPIEDSDKQFINNEDKKSDFIPPRRSLRKKFHPVVEPEKLRTSQNQKKKLDLSNVNDVHRYYTNTRVKRLPTALETIYEDNSEKQSGNLNSFSSRKFKRLLSLGDYSSTNIGKVRKRQLKAKKLTKVFVKRKKVPMEVFLAKINAVDSDTDTGS